MPHLRRRAAHATLILFSALTLSCNALDLFVDWLTVPASVGPGDPFVTASRVCNEGATPSDATVLEFWLRSPTDPAVDVAMGARAVPSLEPGQCQTEETPHVAPTGLADGPYRLMGRLLGSGHERMSPVFGMGWLPDLRVEALNAPPSATPWSPFELDARVCNRGTTWAPPSSLAFYLSDDLVLTGGAGPLPDMPAGILPVTDLPPGACASVSGTANADVPGDLPYLLGAIVDEEGSVPELMEDNNRGLAVLGVGWLPNLRVQSLSAPPSAWNGSSFEVEAVVCNDGTTSSPGSDVSFFFSEDAAIEVPMPPDPALGDFWLGMLPVPSLPPGACQPTGGSVDGSVPFDGAWFLGAVVDEAAVVAELMEFDNDRVGPLMGVGDGPDLVVTEIDAPPSAEHFAGFDASVEVCNHGTGLAGPSELRLFLSADAQLEEMPPGPDSEIASFPVDEISPGGCLNVLVSAFTDASLTGAALLFARADAFETVTELIESNNASAGPWMGIGSGSDFIVQSIVAPASVHGGASFEVTVELCNQGTQTGPPTAVTLYHSTDAIIEGSLPPNPGFDLYAGEIPSPDPLMPGACLALTGMGMADPAADGAYTFGAVVDEIGLEPELREENNSFAGPLMGVGDGPDLMVTQLDAPPSAFPDSSITLDFEVCNQGTAPSAPTAVSFYDSKDALIEFGAPPLLPDGDRWLGEAPAPALESGACHSDSALVWLPSGDLGERHLAAVVDEMDAIPELVETNNVFVGPLLGIGTGPDLVVTRLDAPPSVQLVGPLAVDTQVCNQGTDWSTPAYLWLYLSSDPEIDGAYFDPPSGDPWLGDVSVPGLAPGACHDEVALGAPAVPSEGAWHLGGIVDEGMHVAELIESNNTTLGPLVGVGDGPDLVVVGLDVPPSAELAATFPVSVDVCNQGTGANPPAYVTLYHSRDTEVTSNYLNPGPDVPFAFLDVAPLLPGECRNSAGTGWVSVASSGAWFSAAIVDDETFVPELIETNNSFVGPLMGLGTGPDLVIGLLSAPAGLLVGASFPADVEVCNQGTDWSLPTLVTLYHSDDDVLDGPPPPIPMDTWLGDLAVPDLAPGACHLEAKTVDPGVPGPGFLGAVVDEGDGVPELIEDNNAGLVALDVVGGP